MKNISQLHKSTSINETFLILEFLFLHNFSGLLFETFEFGFVSGVFVNDSPEGRAALRKSDKDLNLLTFHSKGLFRNCWDS